MSLVLRPLHPLFAAEATGIDLTVPLAAQQVAELVAALDRYAVLVLPAQNITDTQQIAFSALLGPLETTVKAYRPGHKARLDLHLSDVSNLDERGQVLPAEDRRRMNGLGNRLWHTDSSFKAIPARYSLLSARAIPGAGGETEFADLRAAWDALAPPMQARIEGLIAEHSLLHSRAMIGFTDFSDEERERLQPVPQRLVRTHPGSGRKTLYLASHAGSIREMALPEARMLLLDLMEHATRREFVYAHTWRLHDLVIWDDRCTLHRARPYDMTVPRDMRRTTVSDGVSSLEQTGAATMSDTLAPLLRDLLAWLARDQRPYADVMEAWRTSCPRLPVWEEATERGFVARATTAGRSMVRITKAGRAFLGRESGQLDALAAGAPIPLVNPKALDQPAER